MIVNSLFRLRWKILLLFFLSVLLAVITTLFLFLLISILHSKGLLPFTFIFRILDRGLGIPIVMIITGAVFFVVYVMVLSWGSVRYLVQITDRVQQLSQGHLQLQIPVKT